MIPFCQPDVSSYASFVADQIISDYIGPGKTTDAFAEALVKYTRAPYVLLTTSGTVALQVALKTVQRDLGSGPILCPAYGVEATANAFRALDFDVEFIDINRTTGCMDPVCLEEYLDEDDAAAVCFVAFSGCIGLQSFSIKEICQEHGIPFIEDAACGLGHWYLGRHAGTVGRIGTLSFSVPKLITTGQGGAVLFEDEADYIFAKNFISQGDYARTGNIPGPGCNLRFNDILSSLGLAQLENIEELLRQKTAVYTTLKQYLSVLETSSGPPLHNIIFSGTREELLTNAVDKGIAARTQYSVMNHHDLYKSDRNFPTAEYWNSHAVYLPFGNSLTIEDAKFIGESVADD